MAFFRTSPVLALTLVCLLGCSSSNDDAQPLAPDPLQDAAAETDQDAQGSDSASNDGDTVDSSATDSSQADGSATDSSAADSSLADSAKPDGSALDSSKGDGSSADTGAADATAWDAGGEVPPQYKSMANLSNQALILALRKLIEDHTSVGYEGAKNRMFGPNGFDVHNGKVECIYSGKLFAPSDLDGTSGFNVEHSWPQSQFGADSSTKKGDMHHLFPTEKAINNCRSTNEFGDVVSFSASCQAGGSGLGKSVSSGANVFSVRMKYRGDIARAHFYFAVRYALQIGAAEEAFLRTWHHQDLPDAEEQARNAAIFAIQKNSNPFVDWPAAVDRIGDF